MEELFIDGRRVDMSEKSSVTLNFKSNLFGELSKITASNSLTIRLPKTVLNRSILGNATAPSVVTDFPYKRHAASYYCNGVAVIDTAYAVLLDSSEEYEVALYWGLMTAFQEWVDAAPSLRDLPGSYSLPWYSTTSPGTLDSAVSYFYAGYDCGVTLDDQTRKTVNIHPSVNVLWLLRQISDSAGITFDFSDMIGQRLKELAIPLLERRTNEVTAIACEAMRLALNTSQKAGGFILTMKPADSSYYYVSDKAMDTLFGDVTASWVGFRISGKVRIDMDIRFDIEADNSQFELVLMLCRSGDGQKIDDAVYIPYTVTSLSQNEYRVQILYGVDLAVERWESIGLVVGPAVQTTDYTLVSSSADGKIDITPSEGEADIEIGDYFPIIPNLPDIKQIDFIKAVCSMCGLFAMPGDRPTTIRLITAGELTDGIDKAEDWSPFLVADSDEPKSTSYAISSFAQRNWMRYKEDDTVVRNADGVLEIDNQTLDASREMLTLPFAASDGRRIPMYVRDEDGDISLQKLQPRIMRLRQDSYTAELTFDGLDFTSLIDEFYDDYSRIIDRGTVIKETLRLNEYRIRNLDYLRPVYLRQYGRYFAIRQIQYKGAEAEVEFVKLPLSITKHPRCNIWSTQDKDGRHVVMADYTVYSDITVACRIKTGTDPNPDILNVVMTKGTSRTELPFIGNIYEVTAVSVSPESDDKYRYGCRRSNDYNRIGLVVENAQLYAVADFPVASTLMLDYNLWIEGAIENPSLGHVTIPVGESKVPVLHTTPHFIKAETVDVTPKYDDQYDYLIR